MKLINPKTVLLGIVVVLGIGVFSYLAKSGQFASKLKTVDEGGKIQIVTSFYPLYYFASQIAGNKADVTNITPAGAEPHDYEPSTQDIARIEMASLVVINGGQLEAWGDKIKEDLKDKNIALVVAADGLVSQTVEEEGEIINDPHVWLDPVLAKAEAQKIMQALAMADPTNRKLYETNGAKLLSKFEQLDQSFREGLKSCNQKNIVTSHAAFGYIASRYGLKQVSITGISPDQEPSPKDLADVANFAKANNVRYIFFETLISPKLSETIAREIGAKTIVFNPLEGLTPEEISEGKDYFSIQSDNLASLKTALECK